MIARFRVLLPFEVSIAVRETLPPHEFRLGNRIVKVFPPHQAQIDPAELIDRTTTPYSVVTNLGPIQELRLDPTVRFGGVETFRANVLQIEVHSEDFDRRKKPEDGTENPGDPPTSFFFEVANSLFRRLRSVGRLPHVVPLHERSALWRLEYLDDSGGLFPRSEDNVRARGGLAISETLSALFGELWSNALKLPPEHEPHAWERLLLDAEAQLPRVIPTIVLLAAAMETLIGVSLDLLAPRDGSGGELWRFITDRGDYRKEPSVAEEFDGLLHALTGHSLKERADLWLAFKEIRDARNTLMHKGHMTIGHKPASTEQAYRLVGKAKETAMWIEQLLPEVGRRPPAPTGPILEYSRALI
jgi:hypothetical protein